MTDLDNIGTPLEGGVASDVRVVETREGPIVVKKALAKLKVAADWFSDPSRSLVEVAAIQAFGDVADPRNFPQIVWVRPDEHCFAMRLVDPRLRNWKTDLLAGRIDLATVARAGTVLGTMHSNSAARKDIAERFEELRFFRELRIEPFFDYVAERKPDLAPLIRKVATELQHRRQALVHGDFSPKNILADGDEIVVLDFEVTHWGDPRFDVGFCLAHLILKSALADGYPNEMRAAIGAFLDAYRKAGLPVIDAGLAEVTACLLLARLFGKSPPDYLERVDAPLVEHVARTLLTLGRAPTAFDFIIPWEHII